MREKSCRSAFCRHRGGAGARDGGALAGGLHPGRGLAPRSRAEVRAIYAALGEQVRTGRLTAPAERVYPMEEIRAAVAHAERGERAGKVLVAPNGPLG